jgi:hypothetical protein
MIFQTKTSLWIVGLTIVAVCAGLLWARSDGASANVITPALGKTSGSAQPELIDDPCQFQKGIKAIMASPELSAAFRDKTEREIHGYGTEISLEKALKIFNAEEKCVPFRGSLPALTQDEILAAIVAGPVYGREQVWRKQKDTLWKILTTKKFPRGSLLTAESGACASDSPLARGELCVKGQRIYLFLNLNNRPRESNPLAPEQIVVIRENYFRVERTD